MISQKIYIYIQNNVKYNHLYLKSILFDMFKSNFEYKCIYFEYKLESYKFLNRMR
jgi:hypothetical protein